MDMVLLILVALLVVIVIFLGTALLLRGKKEEHEYILCAAVWFKDGKIHTHTPVNVDTGFVIAGRRHHNCFYTLSAIGKNLGLNEEQSIKKLLFTEREIQGFITNKDRFVDRKEGAKIAKAANQLKHKEECRILFSEDLY